MRNQPLLLTLEELVDQATGFMEKANAESNSGNIRGVKMWLWATWGVIAAIDQIRQARGLNQDDYPDIARTLMDITRLQEQTNNWTEKG